MTGRTPRAVAMGLERHGALPEAGGERFSGYGVLGLPFAEGDILAFRRVVASSIGPAYTSVWHRDPRGRWTVYVDADPERSCPRYFGTGLARAVETEVRLEWTGPWSVALSVPDHQLDWALRLESRPSTRAWTALAALLPAPLFHLPGPAGILGAMAGWLLDTDPLRFQGRAPNGQRFALRPTRLLPATAAAAVVDGRDLGPLGAHDHSTYLGDLALPARGLFMAGAWTLEPPTNGTHPT